jgi:hypothetical protein
MGRYRRNHEHLTLNPSFSRKDIIEPVLVPLTPKGAILNLEETTMLKSLATIIALTTLTALAAPAANAAGLSPNLSIRTGNTNTTTLARGHDWGSVPHVAPPITHYNPSNLDDSSGNLNPGSGGGGSGTTPVKKPNLQ